jgi:CRP-like cAMP-binding protein
VIAITTAVLAGQPFLRGMPPVCLDALAAEATDVTFPAGHRIFEEGGYAGRFWLIQSGRVALDMQVPGEGPVVIDTIGMGDVLGWSWLFPPYRWAFGAVCPVPVEAFEFNAPALRAGCVTDPVVGYELTRRLIRVLAGRLQSTRLKLVSASNR